MSQSYKENLVKQNKISYVIISFAIGISTLADLAIQYFFKDELLLQPYEMSRIMAIIMIPWIVKPVLGLLTDLVPIFGYRRKLYVMMCGLVSCFCWIYLAFWAEGLYPIVVALFLHQTCMSLSSIVGEAIVVELSNIKARDINNNNYRQVGGSTNPNDSNISENSSDIAKNYVSLFFLFKNAGFLVSAFFRGYLIQLLTLRYVFLLNSIITLSIFVAGFIIVEPKIGDKNHSYVYPTQSSHMTNTVHIDENKYEEYYSVDPAFKETLLRKESLKKKTNDDSVFNKKQLMKEFWEFIKRKETLIPAMMSVLLWASPSLADPLFYYLTNYLLFTPTQMGVLSFISSLGVIVAILSYRIYFKSWSFIKLIMWSTILYCIFTLLVYILILRINIMIGISDFLLCNFGYLFLSIMGELSMMPILTLACTICPKRLEASVYSFFMSSTNLGLSIATLSSSILSYYLGITAHNFDQLGNLIIISNIFSLLPCVLLLYINPKYFESGPRHYELDELQIETAIEQGENVAKVKL